MESLGKKLKELRMKKGLSLEEVAEMVNMQYGTNLTKGMISRWENDIAEPRLDALRALALFYGASLDELLLILDDGHVRDEDVLDEETRAIARDIKDLSTEYRSLLMDMIKTMRERGKEAKNKK